MVASAREAKPVPSPQSGQPRRTVGEVLIMVFLDRWAESQQVVVHAPPSVPSR